MRYIRLTIVFTFLFIYNNLNAQRHAHTFSLSDSSFLLDGKPFQMISGEMHYPRIPREAWRARMKMAKAMGLNTIGTYVFWNLHEPQKGKFDFTGNNDVAEFVKIARKKDYGLYCAQALMYVPSGNLAVTLIGCKTKRDWLCAVKKKNT